MKSELAGCHKRKEKRREEKREGRKKKCVLRFVCRD
jgi:hypothetical protein